MFLLKHFKKPRSLHFYSWWMQRVMTDLVRNIAKTLFMDVTVEGREHLPKKGAAIIASNHPSTLDPIVLKGVINRVLVFFSKAELWRVLVIGFFMRLTGQIPVDRGNRESGRKASATAVDVVKHDGVVVIFPEGGCSNEETIEGLRLFKYGVVRLAFETGVPVTPCALIGTSKVKPLNGKPWTFRLREPLVIRFGEPLDPADFTGDDAVADFLTELRAAIISLMTKPV